MKVLVLIFFVIIYENKIFTQETKSYISFELEKNINDIYIQNSYCFNYQNQYFSLGQGLGINKSFFQQRLFPRWQITYYYSPISFKKLKILGGFEFNYSNIEWNKNKHLFWHYLEYYLCLNIEIGGKRPIGLKSGIGFISELNNDNFKNFKNYFLGISWKFIEFK